MKKTTRKVVFSWLQSPLTCKLASTLLKYNWITSKTLYAYYNYCKNNNTICNKVIVLIDMSFFTFTRCMGKIAQCELHGIMFTNRIMFQSNKKQTFVLFLDMNSEKRDLAKYSMLQNDCVSSLLFSPVSSTPSNPTLPYPTTTPTVTPSTQSQHYQTSTLTSSTSISENTFPLNKVNQDIAEEYNTMVESNPLNLLAQAAVSFHSPPREILNSANRSNMVQQQRQQQPPSHHLTNYSEYCDFSPILDFASVPRLDPDIIHLFIIIVIIIFFNRNIHYITVYLV